MVLQRKVNMLDLYNLGCRKAKTNMQSWISEVSSESRIHVELQVVRFWKS